MDKLNVTRYDVWIADNCLVYKWIHEKSINVGTHKRDDSPYIQPSGKFFGILKHKLHSHTQICNVVALSEKVEEILEYCIYSFNDGMYYHHNY